MATPILPPATMTTLTHSGTDSPSTPAVAAVAAERLGSAMRSAPERRPDRHQLADLRAEDARLGATASMVDAPPTAFPLRATSGNVQYLSR